MKKIILLTTLVSLVGLSFAFKKNPIRYENLKVLPKNTDKKQMDSIMKHFSMSLGVKCNYCHVRENDGQKNFDFASDKNENKLIARSMYKMMNKIYKKYFSEEDKVENRSVNMIPEVSCFSCHHGKKDPENRPPAPAPGAGGSHPAQAPVQETTPKQGI